VTDPVLPLTPRLPGSADPNDRRAARGTTFTTVTAGYFEMFGIPLVSASGTATWD
jgi:hypothetical protein